MKRGWRLDPAWVVYYEKRDAERKAVICENQKQQFQDYLMRNNFKASYRTVDGGKSWEWIY